MLGIHDFWLFVLSGLLLNITPGPDTAFIVGRSVQLGWRGGAAAALGVGAGCLVHIVAAAVGLSALLAASASGVRGHQADRRGLSDLARHRGWLLARASAGARRATRPTPFRCARCFWQGALTNAFNPKVALFFLAFLPQFVDAEAPHKALAFLVLGLALRSSTARCGTWRWRRSPRAPRDRLRRSGTRDCCGSIARSAALFVALGIRVALLQAR